MASQHVDDEDGRCGHELDQEENHQYDDDINASGPLSGHGCPLGGHGGPKEGSFGGREPSSQDGGEPSSAEPAEDKVGQQLIKSLIKARLLYSIFA